MPSNIKHVAIIMDGNGRWAKKRLLPRSAGHIAGVKSTKKAIQFAATYGLESLTIYAFSNENWNRPKEETDHLMNLFVSSLKKEINEMHSNNIQIHFIGAIDELSNVLKSEINQAEHLTEENQGLKLNIALNYGGRSEIIQGIKKLKLENIDIDQLTEDQFSLCLDMPNQSSVDLLIRTGGEQRISNFLLWHLAYAELYFSDLFWPDFNNKEFSKALSKFETTERRFGKTSEQV